VKRSNKEGLPSAETVEGRASPKGNGGRTTAARTQSRGTASNELAAVRQRADGLAVHGGAPVWSEVGNPSSSRQDAPSRYTVRCAAGRRFLPRERFSRVPGMFNSSEVKVLYPT